MGEKMRVGGMDHKYRVGNSRTIPPLLTSPHKGGRDSHAWLALALIALICVGCATFPGFALQGHPRNIDWFHGKEVRVAENGFRGRNNARYANSELDALIDRYFATVPKADRTRVLAQIAHHMSDQLVTIPLIWRVDPTMIGNRLLNVGARGKDATQAWNAHEWDVKS